MVEAGGVDASAEDREGGDLWQGYPIPRIAVKVFVSDPGCAGIRPCSPMVVDVDARGQDADEGADELGYHGWHTAYSLLVLSLVNAEIPLVILCAIGHFVFIYAVLVDAPVQFCCRSRCCSGAPGDVVAGEAIWV